MSSNKIGIDFAEDSEKKTGNADAGTKQLLGNVAVTVIAAAALVFSIVTGMKDRKQL